MLTNFRTHQRRGFLEVTFAKTTTFLTYLYTGSRIHLNKGDGLTNSPIIRWWRCMNVPVQRWWRSWRPRCPPRWRAPCPAPWDRRWYIRTWSSVRCWPGWRVCTYSPDPPSCCSLTCAPPRSSPSTTQHKEPLASVQSHIIDDTTPVQGTGRGLFTTCGVNIIYANILTFMFLV